MQRGRIASIFAVTAGVVVLGISSAASAGLSILSQQVDVDRADQEIIFTLDFNQPPDFKTVDSLGRRADSFQYEIVPNTTTPVDQLPFSAVGTVIRGDEISGKTLPIRSGFANGSDPNPKSGGWGDVRGSVPFTVQGNSLTFTTGFNLIGTTNGVFSYRVFSTNFGSTVTTFESVSVPLPSALAASGATLALFGAFAFLHRRLV